jgi:ComF family protein
VLCGLPAVGMDLCAACLEDLPWMHHYCRCCGLPLPAALPGPVCTGCLTQPGRFDHCVCALHYTYPVDQLITALKFRKQRSYARVLGELLAIAVAEHLQSTQAVPDFIVPVPLHRRRLFVRGYNQAAEIASFLARDLELSVKDNVIARVRSTASQSGLTQAQRHTNLHRAFRVTSSVIGKRIVLIDDVLTTGATVTELMRTLRRAGAAEVSVWAVARTVVGK